MADTGFSPRPVALQLATNMWECRLPKLSVCWLTWRTRAAASHQPRMASHRSRV